MSAAAHALPGLKSRPRRTSSLDDLIVWAFGIATVVTNIGKAMFAERMRTTPATYTVAPKFLALGVGAHETAGRTAAAADVALTNEKESRVEGTQGNETTSVTKDTYTLTGSLSITGSRAVDEAGVFDASTSGNMAFSATHEVDNVVNGDTVAYTWKIKQS